MVIQNSYTLHPDARTQASRDQFREAMSLVPSAVHIVTSDGDAGRCGLTATAVLSVSDTPPTVLISLSQASVSANRLMANKVFCVNALATADQSLAEIFAGRTDTRRDDRFALGEWSELVTRSPVLLSAQAVFDCRLVASYQAATHHLLIGEVVAMRSLSEKSGSLIYINRRFREV